MPLPIEDYALIGDMHTTALVGRDGSIDWLCLPRFDSPACFAALLGGPEHGRWRISPTAETTGVRRRYRDGTLILETKFTVPGGSVLVIDFMPVAEDTRIDVARIVTCLAGEVEMEMELLLRFDYGHVIPWLRHEGRRLNAIAGPHAAVLETPLEFDQIRDGKVSASFVLRKGESVPFLLTFYPSHEAAPHAPDISELARKTEDWWLRWSGAGRVEGRWREPVIRSLITLKALTYRPTGGIVAAATTSLPERLGGVRNWDYRFCWVRDATLTLYALVNSGYVEEAMSWREWLLRAVAGAPKDLRTIYGVAGERDIYERELPWLPGYFGSAPVRVGNLAHGQVQLDIFGEIAEAFLAATEQDLPVHADEWRVHRSFMDYLETAWDGPDHGVWEVRGPRRHFTHSKVMAWVAIDRSIRAAELLGLKGPLERWRKLRMTIHADVCERGYNPHRGAFVQYYGADELDAATLTIPLVGFLPPDDPRVRGTVAAIETELMDHGLLRRYRTTPDLDGLPVGEGVFLPCTFWYADVLNMQGRKREATALFERLLSLRNDVGLLAEEYDPRAERMLGNFPQAWSHIGIINTAQNLQRATEGPAWQRAHE